MLDAALAEGWYRSGQLLFTTNRLQLEERGERIISDVLWARVDLERWVPPKRHRRLAARKEAFTQYLSAAVITPEIEALYARYLAHTNLDSGPTVAALLLGPSGPPDFFPGRLLTVRDGDRLIAAGYFDEGANATAAIVNFYDPDYARHSLGLWLYFEVIRLSATVGKRWFYPGYIATQYPKFDYKLLAGPEFMETRDPDRRAWEPYRCSRHAAAHGYSCPDGF